MTEPNPNKSMHENVLAAIKAGQVKMRPRWQFILRAGLFVTGVVLAALVVLFVGSFVVFLMHQSGVWFVPAFGGRGLKELLLALPLVFIAVAFVFIILLQLLVRRYSFTYARPILYSVIGIAAFVTLGSFLVAQTHLHEGLFRQAEEERLPIIGGLYRQFGEPGEDERITPGVIIETTGTGFNMHAPRNREYQVVLTRDTRLPDDADFEAGDNVIVLGDMDGTVIIAEGVRKIERREEFFLHRPPSPVR